MPDQYDLQCTECGAKTGFPGPKEQIEEWRAKLTDDDGKCANCGADIELDVVPIPE